MAIDFNEAEQQSSGKKYGPVPMGSKGMLKMELKESTNHQANAPFIAVSRGGVNMLWIELTVNMMVSIGVKTGCSPWYLRP